ncbi:MAG: glycerate kinase [Methylacidiphilales bacterium]|nr:glycerate kinase [Candidatus Methylacidiphilales bacterium]
MPQDRKKPPFSDQNLRRVLIAPDKFKGTLTSGQAAQAIERGLRRAWPKVKTTRFILTDGGEGFMEFMVRQTGGRLRRARTVDAALRPCRAEWGVLGNRRTAVIGLTSASGIAQLPLRLRNPEETTNLGTGELLARAVREGYREILVGLGGSATTEGGISLAKAIGYKFIDKDWCEITLNGGGLANLGRIVPPSRMPRANFVVATDVDNPLFGPCGAAYQFAPQKGADAAMVARLDAGLRRLARIVRRDLGKDYAKEPGAGAAGGCGYGLMAFFNAKRENGFQLVRRLTKLDALIRRHDLVITGEGCFDRTSLLGKAPAQLGELARRLKRPVWALCGRVELPLSRSPFDRIAALSTRQNPGPPPESLSPAQHAKRLERLAYEMGKGHL